jgi:hypothetical protein
MDLLYSFSICCTAFRIVVDESKAISTVSICCGFAIESTTNPQHLDMSRCCRFVVDLSKSCGFVQLLYSKSTTNRTSGVIRSTKASCAEISSNLEISLVRSSHRAAVIFSMVSPWEILLLFPSTTSADTILAIGLGSGLSDRFMHINENRCSLKLITAAWYIP